MSFLLFIAAHKAAASLAFGWMVREWQRLSAWLRVMYPSFKAEGGIWGIAKTILVGQKIAAQPAAILGTTQTAATETAKPLTTNNQT